MKTTIQTRLALLMKARKYAEKIQKGSVFVADLDAARLIEEMVVTIQDLLSDNLRLEEQMKFQKAFKNKKESIE